MRWSAPLWLFTIKVPAKGFEPLTPYGEQFLRLPRIPFRHAGQRLAATVYAMRPPRRKPAATLRG